MAFVTVKPCPQCGNTGEKVEITLNGDCIHDVAVHFNGVTRWVECSDCGHKGPYVETWEGAWKMWNKASS